MPSSIVSEELKLQLFVLHHLAKGLLLFHQILSLLSICCQRYSGNLGSFSSMKSTCIAYPAVLLSLLWGSFLEYICHTIRGQFFQD
jgi:hypothetical protein